MEESNNQTNGVPVEDTNVTTENTHTQEYVVETVESVASDAVGDDSTVVSVSNEEVANTVTVDTVLQTEVPTETSNTVLPDPNTAESPVATPLVEKPKIKINKTVIIILVIVVVFGGVMLMMNGGGTNTRVGEVAEEEQEIKVNVGTTWGNQYLTYMMKNKNNLEKYEISFVDFNNDDTPEMLLQYIDNSELKALKILYIADDEVYETKYYHDYRIRLIYSLKTKTTDWYLFLTTSKHYGSYTMLSKIVDSMAFDSDIKARNDNELIKYGKEYFDTDYSLVFYNVNKNSSEDDFRNFIAKYDGYKKKIDEMKSNVESKYSGVEIQEEIVEESNTVFISGREYHIGNYYALIEEKDDEEQVIDSYTAAITLNKNGTIIVNGILSDYTVDPKGGSITCGSHNVGLESSDIFDFNGHLYYYKEVE